VFSNDVSDQHGIYVMIIKGDDLVYIKYPDTITCTGFATIETCFVGVCVKGALFNYKEVYTAESSDSAEKACFAGSKTLSLELGEVRAISDVRVGDRVLSADAAGRTSYSDMAFVPHRANSDDALFTHITTASGCDIKMTPSHIILAATSR
jgi:Hint module